MRPTEILKNSFPNWRLMNQSGFYFGPNSFVSAAGLIVTTAPIAPMDSSAPVLHSRLVESLQAERMFDKALTECEEMLRRYAPGQFLSQSANPNRSHGCCRLFGCGVDEVTTFEL